MSGTTTAKRKIALFDRDAPSSNAAAASKKVRGKLDEGSSDGSFLGNPGTSNRQLQKETCEGEPDSASSDSSSDDDNDGSDSSSEESDSGSEDDDGGSEEGLSKSGAKGAGYRGNSRRPNSAVMDTEQLYKDAVDREKLNQMSEYDRERVLTARYNDWLKAQQRSQLFEHSEASRKKAEKEQQQKRAAFLDIRAKRHRQKQKQGEGEEDEEEDSDLAKGKFRKQEEESSGSSSSSSSDEDSEGEEGDSDEDRDGSSRDYKRTTPVGGGGGSGSSSSGRRAAAEPPRSSAATAGDGLFADGEIDDDTTKNAKRREKVLNNIGMELLQSVRLSVEKVLHMLEHPKAQEYLTGCFVTLEMAGGEAISSIVGVENSPDVYYVGESGQQQQQCRHLLRLRPGTMQSLEKTVRVSQIVNTAISAKDFLNWKMTLKDEKSSVSIDDWPKRMKAKAQQLKEFTYTEEDVQRILDRNLGSRGGINQGGSIVKQKQIILHEIETLRQDTLPDKSRRPKLEELQTRYRALEAIESQRFIGSGTKDTSSSFSSHHAAALRRSALGTPFSRTSSSLFSPASSITAISPSLHFHQHHCNGNDTAIGGGGGGGSSGLGGRAPSSLTSPLGRSGVAVGNMFLGGANGVGGGSVFLAARGNISTPGGLSAAAAAVAGRLGVAVGRISSMADCGAGGGSGDSTLSAERSNPFARRECRPTMMWDIRSSSSSAVAETRKNPEGGSKQMADSDAAAPTAGGGTRENGNSSSTSVGGAANGVINSGTAMVEVAPSASELSCPQEVYDEIIACRVALSRSSTLQKQYLEDMLEVHRSADLIGRLQIDLSRLSREATGGSSSSNSSSSNNSVNPHGCGGTTGATSPTVSTVCL